jgi:hypothetical protein
MLVLDAMTALGRCFGERVERGWASLALLLWSCHLGSRRMMLACCCSVSMVTWPHVRETCGGAAVRTCHVCESRFSATGKPKRPPSNTYGVYGVYVVTE